MDDSFTEFSNALAQNKSRIHVWKYDEGGLQETADLGTFFTQYVYLVLHVNFQLDNKTQNTIYLWCGAFSNPDDEGPVNERIQILFGLLHSNASVHHEYEGYECSKFLEAFIPFGGVRHRTPGLEYVTNRGFSTLYTLRMDPVPHWKESPASVSSLQPSDVNYLRTRSQFTLWIGFRSEINGRLRAAELAGAFRQCVGHEDLAKLVYQGQDDKDFLRALAPSPIEEPERADIPQDDPTRREVYQVISSGDELDFTLAGLKNEASLALCNNDNAYILRDSEGIFVWFGKNQAPESMGIGLVVAIVFMQRMNISRNVHIQIVRSGEKFSTRWQP